MVSIYIIATLIYIFVSPSLSKDIPIEEQDAYKNAINKSNVSKLPREVNSKQGKFY